MVFSDGLGLIAPRFIEKKEYYYPNQNYDSFSIIRNLTTLTIKFPNESRLRNWGKKALEIIITL